MPPTGGSSTKVGEWHSTEAVAAEPRHSIAINPAGLIDPRLKTISFWNGDQPLLALHAYATHPMSYYGGGEVSSDFVGLARDRRQRDDFSVKQIYVSGCSGDVTAGKFNTGSTDDRYALRDRLYQAMVTAWKNTRRVPLERLIFRSTPLSLEFHPAPQLTETALAQNLHDANQTVEKRILAAMGLSSRHRVSAGEPIDVVCIDFGPAQIVLLPGESFVGYQLMAQGMRPDSFVMAIGYGECWPGYIPTESAFEDGFEDSWLWVAPGSEHRMREALQKVLVGQVVCLAAECGILCGNRATPACSGLLPGEPNWQVSRAGRLPNTCTRFIHAAAAAT